MEDHIAQTSLMEQEYSTFKVGEALFGINIVNIQEINKHFDVTTVPQSSNYIKGILNLRGRIITIIDLGKKLGLAPVRKNKHNRNIIVNSKGEYIGLFVDAIGDVMTAGQNSLESAPASISGVNGFFLKGVLKTKKQLIGILDIDEVLKE